MRPVEPFNLPGALVRRQRAVRVEFALETREQTGVSALAVRLPFGLGVRAQRS
jgi:hypothetical protein